MPPSCSAGSEPSAELSMLSREGDLRRRRPSGPEEPAGRAGGNGWRVSGRDFELIRSRWAGVCRDGVRGNAMGRDD